MLSYFMSADYTISDKLVQIMYILSGLFCMYCGVRAWMVKANKHYIPTGCFWFALGIVVAFGQWLPAIASGIIVAIGQRPCCAEHGKTRQSGIRNQRGTAEEL